MLPQLTEQVNSNHHGAAELAARLQDLADRLIGAAPETSSDKETTRDQPTGILAGTLRTAQSEMDYLQRGFGQLYRLERALLGEENSSLVGSIR